MGHDYVAPIWRLSMEEPVYSDQYVNNFSCSFQRLLVLHGSVCICDAHVH